MTFILLVTIKKQLKGVQNIKKRCPITLNYFYFKVENFVSERKHFHVLNMLIAIFSITISLVKKYLNPREIITVDQANFVKRFSSTGKINF